MTNVTDGMVEDIFQRILPSLWLRPERALMDAYELSIARKFLGKSLRQPALEWGCTDGVPSFVMLGGTFQKHFDDYMEIEIGRNSYKEHNGLGSDYFDHVDDKRVTSDIIAVPPLEKFTTGVSWKKSHIQKARRLNIYEELHVAEFGAPMDFLRPEHYRTIWAPNLFWMDDDQLDGVLKSLRQTITEDGRMVTFFPNEKQPKHLFYPQMLSADESWAKDMDRGIHENLSNQAKGCEHWRTYFSSRGWSMVRHETFLPALVCQIYQIGLRPMFPVFMNMYQRLRKASPEGLLDLKEHWIETAKHFLLPMCRKEWMAKMGQPDVWDIYEFKPIMEK